MLFTFINAIFIDECSVDEYDTCGNKVEVSFYWYLYIINDVDAGIWSYLLSSNKTW